MKLLLLTLAAASALRPLAIDVPRLPHDSLEKAVLDKLNLVFTVMFTVTRFGTFAGTVSLRLSLELSQLGVQLLRHW